MTYFNPNCECHYCQRFIKRQKIVDVCWAIIGTVIVLLAIGFVGSLDKKAMFDYEQGANTSHQG